MRKITTLLFLTVFFNQINSQSPQLIGSWVLDKVLHSDGTILAINDPLFSKKMIYTVSPGKLKISNYIFSASFTSKCIKTDFKKINYSFQEGYLKMQDENDENVYYFLKTADFISRYPEYALKSKLINNDTVYIANEVTDFDFKNEVSFDDFILKNKEDMPSKDFEELYFRVEFLLTKDSQIKDIKVLNSISDEYDNGYIKALKMAGKYMRNNSGKNLLFTKEANHLKFYDDLTNEDEKKLLEIILVADDYFYKNDFQKAIPEYTKINTLTIKNNRFSTVIKEARINLGISLLATGDVAGACAVFNKIGDSTDFEVRNYLISFCK